MARPHTWLRAPGVALVLLLVLAPVGAAAIHPRAGNLDLSQCANDPSGIGDCVYEGGNEGWVTGDLNQSKSLYREGDFVPFRLVITGLEEGHTYTQGIGYDAVEKSLHTYDYLGTYNASENYPGPPPQQIVPCGGITIADTGDLHPCGGPPSTLAVPTDTNTHFPSGSSQAPGHFSAWGATLTGAAYDTSLDTPIGVNPTQATIERGINLTFTANGPTAVIAWGGHIASVLDWGQGKTFKSGGGSGAAWHMRLTTGGNEELSINENGIADQPPSFTTQASPQSVTVGEPVMDTATITGTSGSPVTGDVRFFVCGPSGTPPDCTQGGMEVEPQLVVLSRVNLGPDGAASIVFTPTEPGDYCFRAEYTPGPAAHYSPALHTDTTTECFVATGPPIPPTATLEVKKVCRPPGDNGHFTILIQTTDGQPVKRHTVACGGTTGAVPVHPGSYTVRERGANGTDLTDYRRFVGGDCKADGTITIEAGDAAVCTIANVHKGTPSAELTVTKICVPADDGGRFNLTIDDQTAQDVPCGGSFGPVPVPPGLSHVSESAGTGTSLSDYTSTIGGACAVDGTVTLAAGQLATCTITNARTGEATGTIEVQKQCSPAGTKGTFQLEFDGQVARGIACGESTGPVTVPVGAHQIGEVAMSGQSSIFQTTISGGCSPDGSFTLSAGQHVVCVVTNTLQPLTPPQPPRACYTLSVRPQTVIVGRRARVVARVHLGRRGVPGVRVFAVGPGVAAVRTTASRGEAVFVLTPPHRGMLRFTIRRPFMCPKPDPGHVGVIGVATPPITG
jgi:hypothetical protein